MNSMPTYDSDLDLRNGKSSAVKTECLPLYILIFSDLLEGPECNGEVCVYDDGTIFSDVPQPFIVNLFGTFNKQKKSSLFFHQHMDFDCVSFSK